MEGVMLNKITSAFMTGSLLAAVGFAGFSATAANAASAASAATGAATAKATAAVASYTPAKRTLKVGDRGSDVKALQQRLAQLKYNPGGTDGNFGQNTEEAVWAFQAVQGLAVDGVVGPATQRALVHPRSPVSHDPRGGKLRVEVNLKLQVLLLYRGGQLALVSHVSSGGGYYFCDPGTSNCSHAITPTGNYHAELFLPGWVKVPLGEMYNPVFFIGSVYAIHGDTYVPAKPVSHGCVRIPMFIAQYFHTLVKVSSNTKIATPVYIYKG